MVIDIPKATKAASDFAKANGPWALVAIIILCYCGFLLSYVLRENAKREARLTRIIETYAPEMQECNDRLANIERQNDDIDRNVTLLLRGGIREN